MKLWSQTKEWLFWRPVWSIIHRGSKFMSYWPILRTSSLMSSWGMAEASSRASHKGYGSAGQQAWPPVRAKCHLYWRVFFVTSQQSLKKTRLISEGCIVFGSLHWHFKREGSELGDVHGTKPPQLCWSHGRAQADRQWPYNMKDAMDKSHTGSIPIDPLSTSFRFPRWGSNSLSSDQTHLFSPFLKHCHEHCLDHCSFLYHNWSMTFNFQINVSCFLCRSIIFLASFPQQFWWSLIPHFSPSLSSDSSAKYTICLRPKRSSLLLLSIWSLSSFAKLLHQLMDNNQGCISQALSRIRRLLQAIISCLPWWQNDRKCHNGCAGWMC